MNLAENFKVILSTAPSKNVAENLAKALLSQKLAACVNILPGVESIYEWEGKIEQSSEVLLIAKTSEDLLPALFEFFAEQHPYDCPELLSLTPSDISDDYRKWLGSVLSR